MKSVAILQARTNSLRLPGKVLLPVNGVALVVLAARRAANTGRDVVVATSDETTDDALAEMLSSAGITCYRGSLENTLQRVVDALDGYCDDALVFRLTADNVIPDGALLDEMEEEFLHLDMKYLCCNGEKSGLPYGVSAELTRARYLREAAKSTKCKYDEEHVTPYIKRKFGDTYFTKYKHLNKGHFRCTVDCLDDYLVIQQLFAGIAAPELVPAFTLIDKLTHLPCQPLQEFTAKKFVVGTAQLGLTYGIANYKGRPDQILAEKLIKKAIVNGAQYLDTARAYGDSEGVIGNALKSGWEGRVQIVTKLSPLADCPANADSSTVSAFVDASIYHSCTSLRTKELDVLMLHRASQLWDWSGAVWNRLLEFKSGGVVKALGVSIQTPLELERALAISDVEFIQMPYNVLDWRWDALVPRIRAIKQRKKLFIHARSSLLQGLLPTKAPEAWRKANVDAPSKVINWLAEQCGNFRRASVADFCLSFVKSTEWIDGVVIGMESIEQLDENIEIFCGADFSQQELSAIIEGRPLLKEHTLNPAHWRE